MCSSLASGMPGPVILHADFDDVPVSRARRAMRPSRGENEAALPSRLRSTCTRRPSTPWTTRRSSGGVEVDVRVVVAARGFVDFGERGQDRLDVDGFDGDAGEFGVDARGVGDVGDQPVEPADVFGDDGEQAALLFGVLDAAQGFDGAADGGERVLDFVRDVGGEALDGVHAGPQRAGGIRPARGRAGRFRRHGRAGRRASAPPRPLPSRMPRAAPARRRIGRAMVSERYQDSATVRTSARANKARMDRRMASRLSSTSRVSRVSSTMPTEVRLRMTGSATVTSRRLSWVRRI